MCSRHCGHRGPSERVLALAKLSSLIPVALSASRESRCFGLGNVQVILVCRPMTAFASDVIQRMLTKPPIRNYARRRRFVTFQACLAKAVLCCGKKQDDQSKGTKLHVIPSSWNVSPKVAIFIRNEQQQTKLFPA